MGSSGGGGTPRAPMMPAPPSNLISSMGSTAPFTPNYTSFLPSDPTAMATGLTPEMLQSINRPPPPPPVQQASAGLSSPDAMRAMIAQMIAKQTPSNFTPRNTNPGSAFSPFGASSNSGGGYQSMRSGPMLTGRGGR